MVVKTIDMSRASLLLLLRSIGFGNFKTLASMIRADTHLFLVNLWFQGANLAPMTTFQFQAMVDRYQPRESVGTDPGDRSPDRATHDMYGRPLDLHRHRFDEDGFCKCGEAL